MCNLHESSDTASVGQTKKTRCKYVTERVRGRGRKSQMRVLLELKQNKAQEK